MKKMFRLFLAALLAAAVALPSVCGSLAEDGEEWIFIKNGETYTIDLYGDNWVSYSVTGKVEPDAVPSPTQTADDYEYLESRGGSVIIVDYHGQFKPVSAPQTLEGKPVLHILNSAYSSLLRTSGDFQYYPLSSTEGELAGYSGSARILTLPQQLDGLTMVGVGDNAFSWNQQAEVIEIPGSYRYIGEHAFYYSAQYYVLHEGLEDIGDYAFSACAQGKMGLPQSLRHIGKNPFCKDVNVLGSTPILWFLDTAGENPFFASGGGMLYSKEDQRLISYYGGDQGSEIVIPEGIRTIGEWAFAVMPGVETVTLPDSVERIEDGAFMFCENLREINLPDSLAFINASAFMNCLHLTCVVSPGSYAEEYCLENEMAYRFPDEPPAAE